MQQVKVRKKGRSFCAYLKSNGHEKKRNKKGKVGHIFLSCVDDELDMLYIGNEQGKIERTTGNA